MKKNNRGFTLIEVIIAITIFTIVIGLGYKLMNSTSAVTKNQLKVFTEQQAANLVNKYITNDLERVKEFTNADIISNPYKYTIKSVINGNLKEIEYEVFVDKEKNTYSVTRRLGTSSIEIINNQPTDGNEPPFLIEPKEGFTNKYEVKLNGQNKTGDIKKYVFEVSSRIVGYTESINDDVNGEGSTGDDNSEGETGGLEEQILDGEIKFLINGNGSKKTVSNTITISEIQKFDKAMNVKDIQKASIEVYIPITSNEATKKITSKITINQNNDNEINSNVIENYKDITNTNVRLIKDRIEIYYTESFNLKDSIKVSVNGSSRALQYDNDKEKYYINLEGDRTGVVTITCGINDISNGDKECLFSVEFGDFNKQPTS